MLLLEESRLNHMSSRHRARDSSTSSPHVLLAASNNRNNNNSAQLCCNIQHGSCSFGERCKYVHSNPADARNRNNNNRPTAAQWNNTTGRVMHGHRITICPARPTKMSYAPEHGTIPKPMHHTPTWTSLPPQCHPTVTPFGSRGVLGPTPGQAHVVQPIAIGSSDPSSYTTGHRLVLGDLRHHAMLDEYNALISNDGSLRRYKAPLIANGHSQQQDSSLFIYRHGTSIAYLLIVDDIILTPSSTELLQQVIASLYAEFSMTYLGPLNYFLGISTQRTSSGFILSHSTYAREVLERAGMLNCNASNTPPATESKLGPDGDSVSDPTLYRSLVGSLQYFTFTRPDISYAVQQVCLFMLDPREPHFSALKRILRYVRGPVAPPLGALPRATVFSTAKTLFYGPLSANTLSLARVPKRSIVVSPTLSPKVIGFEIFFENYTFHFAPLLWYIVITVSLQFERPLISCSNCEGSFAPVGASAHLLLQLLESIFSVYIGKAQSVGALEPWSLTEFRSGWSVRSSPAPTAREYI
nr:ribonuclease H-like domain-containing protein [Tanacetum cinerariifolium]